MNGRGRLLFWTIVLSVGMPFVPLLLWSFSERWFFPDLWPQEFGLRAWGYVFTTAGSQIIGGLATSFLLALTTAVISLLVGIPAGRALGLYDFPGKRLVALVLVLPVIVPPLAVAMGLHFWFIRLGLAETFAGVVLIHLTFCVPYAIFVLWGVFSDYNPEIEEQARTLGASAGRVVWSVMLPMILPGVTVAALFSFLLSWSQYLSTLIIGGGKLLTLPILLFALMDSGDRPVAAAVSLVFVVPAFVALVASARSIGRRGLQGVR
ncbi:MAG: ABC transporter permease subunit [Desulfofustis sp.]|jgi:putative spermidine/putrescine transport system permease protein|nr:ABC transporter permease subunit [Desulfofustis sp.]